MPELPEVETIRRNLNTVIKGDGINHVVVYYRPIVSNDIDFETKLQGQHIHEVKREAKYLKFILDDYVLISHLRMEGKYFINEERNIKHTHVEFYLSSGNILSYQDTRKFGRFELIPRSIEDTYLRDRKKLAKDPADIDFNDFYQRIIKKNKTIKEILLDQSVIGGIGNIYVNEILYLSKLHPAKKGFMIKKEDAVLLFENTKKVIDKAVLMGGTTIDTFESLGHKGEFQQELNVHGKTGSICKVCGDKIRKVQLKGRGTYYCPSCQKSHVIAMTGGIATGKTSVTDYLLKKGFKVIDSDAVVKSLYENQEISYMIGKAFDSLTNDKLDKNKLASIIFNDKEKRLELESILHPLVFEQIEHFKASNFEHLLFLDIPLLFETKYQGFDTSLLIDADESLQIERLKVRNNLTEEEALARIHSQIPLAKKRKLADAVITNNKTLLELHQQIDNFLKKF